MLPLVRKPDKKYFKMFLSAIIEGRKDYARPAMSLADGKKEGEYYSQMVRRYKNEYGGKNLQEFCIKE